jgi:hypothetical protein
LRSQPFAEGEGLIINGVRSIFAGWHRCPLGQHPVADINVQLLAPLLACMRQSRLPVSVSQNWSRPSMYREFGC